MDKHERPYDPFITRMQSRRLFDWRAPSPAEEAATDKVEARKSDWLTWIAQLTKSVALSAVSVVGLLVIGIGLFDLVVDAWQRKVVVEPISVPKVLADKGYTPETATRQFRDALLKIRRSAGAPTEDLDVDMRINEEILNISAPGLGLPLESVSALLQIMKRVGTSSVISGEIVYIDSKLRLRLFKDGAKFFPDAVVEDLERPEKLMEAAAQEYTRLRDPLSLSTFLSATRPDEAILVARTAIERVPESDQKAAAKAHDVLGDLLRRAPRDGCKGPEEKDYQSRQKKALREYERAIELDPSFAKPHNGRGLALAEIGREKYGDAKLAFEKAVLLAPNFAAPYNNIGVYKRRYEGSRNDPVVLEDIMANFRKAIELAQGNGLYRYNYGLALNEAGRRDEAIAEFKKSILFAPRFASPRIQLGVALRDYRLQPEDAIVEFDRAIQVDRCSALAHYHKGLTLHFDLQNFGDALNEYESALQIDPKFAEPAYFRGYLQYCNRDDPKAAVDAFRRASEIARGKAWHRFSLGVALQDAGRKDEAETEIREAAAKTDRAVVRNYRGEMLLSRNDSQGARKEFIAAIALDPQTGAAYRNLGKIFRKDGNARKALEQLRTAVKNAPDSWENHAELAALLAELGMHDEGQMEQLVATEQKGKSPTGIEKRSSGWKVLCTAKPRY